jgi:hypothetical protein
MLQGALRLAPLAVSLFIAAAPSSAQVTKQGASASSPGWSCSADIQECAAMFGMMRYKDGNIESWESLQVGNGKDKKQELRFTSTDIIVGPLSVSKRALMSVRRYNLSDYRSTVNGVPRRFILRYQFLFKDGDQLKGFIADAMDIKTMRLLDDMLSTWHPLLPIVDNNPWYFGGA